jgi:uncharacterized protein YegP (UPF0339 family)
MRFKIYEAKDAPGGQKGRWRWQLWSSSDIVAESGEGYVSKAECRRMIERIQSECPDAPIEEE